MVMNIAAHTEARPTELHPTIPLQRGTPGVTARKRFGSLILYTVAALALAVICSVAFNILDHNMEFAIAIMGSLIGGFLGAMLAAALIVDIYAPNRGNDQNHSG